MFLVLTLIVVYLVSPRLLAPLLDNTILIFPIRLIRLWSFPDCCYIGSATFIIRNPENHQLLFISSNKKKKSKLIGKEGYIYIYINLPLCHWLVSYSVYIDYKALSMHIWYYLSAMTKHLFWYIYIHIYNHKL